jgi:signal transduction histidine kinase
VTEDAVPVEDAGNLRLALGLAFGGLAVCAFVLALSSPRNLGDPLTLALAICAACAAATQVSLDRKLLVDASFVPALLAIAFLGAWASVAVVLVAEASAWAVSRYRLKVVPINVFAAVTAMLLGSGAFSALSLSPGTAFYLAIGAAGFATLGTTYFVVVTLVSVLDGNSIRGRLGQQLKLAPMLGINVAMAVAVAAVYVSSGLKVIAFVLALILAFNYMVRQTLLAQQKTQEVEALAAMRGRLVAQTLDAEERERRGLAEALHDGAIQLLLTAQQDLLEYSQGDRSAAERARQATTKAVEALRDAVKHLHPAVLRRAGLLPALEALAHSHAERARFDLDLHVDPACPSDYDRLIFFLSRELLNNVAKHSAAKRVVLSARVARGTVVLAVSDDGKGFDPSRLSDAVAAGHIGLASVMERAESAGGKASIESSPGTGSLIRVVLPLSRQHHSAAATAEYHAPQQTIAT